MSSEFEDRAQEEQDFEAYLRRDSQVSQRYRELGGRVVPPALDHKVLERARQHAEQRVQQTAQGRVQGRPWLRWGPPIAVAACALLAVSVVLQPDVQRLAAPEPASLSITEQVSDAGGTASTAEAQSAFERESPARESPERESVAGENDRALAAPASQDESARGKAQSGEPPLQRAAAAKDSALSDALAAPGAAASVGANSWQPRSAAQPIPPAQIGGTSTLVVPAPVAAAPPIPSTPAERARLPEDPGERPRAGAVPEPQMVERATAPSGGSRATPPSANIAAEEPARVEPEERSRRAQLAKLEATSTQRDTERKALEGAPRVSGARADLVLPAAAPPPVAPEPAPPEPARAGESTLELDRTLAPELWVMWIRRFREAGNDVRADELLQRLRTAHPDFKVPVELLPTSPP